MDDCGCEVEGHRVGTRADVDNTAWDGGAAMSNCASSDTPASCYGSICAGRRSGDSSKQESWALPHHKTPGAAPNAAGVRNALSRLPQTEGLTNKAAAQTHLDAHMKAISPESAAEPVGAVRVANGRVQPPKENVVRGIFRLRGEDGERRAIVLRSGAGQGMPTLAGHFAVFNEWTEIDNWFEGNFMETIAPGAFKKTFKDNRSAMRVLFQHGRDPILGDKPLGPIDTLEEDDIGAAYAVPMLDTGYNSEIIPGLREGLYGASFRFRVTKEEVDQKPEASDFNPKGIPQRTIREMDVFEFGPVTFPAYESATAGLRSLTVDWLERRLLGDPENLRALMEHYIAGPRPEPTAAAPALGGEPGDPTPPPPSRTTVPTPPPMSQEAFLVSLDRHR